MATLYTSDRLPQFFAQQDPGGITNGTMAKASIVNTIADNHIYMACANTPFTNFYMKTDTNRTAFGSGAWTNEAKAITIQVPPFCQYVEFYFYAAKDYRTTSATESYIEVATSGGLDTKRITHIPAGEDITTTGKGTFDDAFSGRWVRASGISQHPLSDDPGALKLKATPDNTWDRIAVVITVSEYCYVFAAAYHVFPGRSTYTITY